MSNPNPTFPSRPPRDGNPWGNNSKNHDKSAYLCAQHGCTFLASEGSTHCKSHWASDLAAKRATYEELWGRWKEAQKPRLEPYCASRNCPNKRAKPLWFYICTHPGCPDRISLVPYQLVPPKYCRKHRKDEFKMTDEAGREGNFLAKDKSEDDAMRQSQSWEKGMEMF
ncbi:hypothetical protein MKZ38_003460 [Zalerion maritima]|uniref:Uncharacterized protein n=1 Tax=Zalerion maritima TaxID=339359 RepID=A0AAD5WXK4_9PEZI|nr:hypothetical protein MKZ38_003460 [Zalerion maritima]